MLRPARPNRNTLFCFSPPVMVATMIIELTLAGYTAWRYKLTPTTRLIILLLVSLAAFQLAEFQVCDGSADIKWLWARIGHVAITLMPAMGIHLSYTIAGVRRKPLAWFAYATAALFAGYFLFTAAIVGNRCLGNYVIFQLDSHGSLLYGYYYYGWLLAGMLLNWRLEKHHKNKKIHKALAWLILGYASFIVPTTAANIFAPESRGGIPSVMCGFAVIFAIILGAKVLPNVGKVQRTLKL